MGHLWGAVVLGKCSKSKIWIPTVPGEAGIDDGSLLECPAVAKPSPGSALLG